MKPEKAIEILEERLKTLDPTHPLDCYGAIKLGIEALKFTLAVRGTILNYATLKLPGETEE